MRPALLRIASTIAAGAFVVLVMTPTQAFAASPTVTGAGSTWSQNAVDQWRADVSKFGLKINFQGVGSSAGRNFYILDQVDFAVSEIPFTPDEMVRLNGRKFAYLPIVAGGTSLMYNLSDAAGHPITNLRLSPPTIAKIFTGAITNWADPAVTADNGYALPSKPIAAVVRSDGSGTSAQLSAFFAARTPDVWRAFAQQQGIPATYTSNWPIFTNAVGQAGSDGVANYVNNGATGPGSITYVETSYAIERRRPVVAVKNASGNFVLPTSTNVATALKLATLNADRTQNLGAVYTNPDATAYPISSYSYMIVPSERLDPAKGSVLAQFIYYFACAGQAKATPLGYSPLPANLVSAAFAAAATIPGAGAPPTLDYAHCRNPNLAGSTGTGTATTTTTSPHSSTQGASSGVTSSATGTGAGASAGGTEGAGRGSGSDGAAGRSGDASSGDASGDAAGSGAVAAPATVRLRGGDASGTPLLLAGLGLLVLVLAPPAVAGAFARRRG